MILWEKWSSYVNVQYQFVKKLVKDFMTKTQFKYELLKKQMNEYKGV